MFRSNWVVVPLLVLVVEPAAGQSSRSLLQQQGASRPKIIRLTPGTSSRFSRFRARPAAATPRLFSVTTAPILTRNTAASPPSSAFQPLPISRRRPVPFAPAAPVPRQQPQARIPPQLARILGLDQLGPAGGLAPDARQSAASLLAQRLGVAEFPQNFGATPNNNNPLGQLTIEQQQSIVLSLLGRITKKLAQSTGLQNFLQQQNGVFGSLGAGGGPARGPPIAGLPNIPGVPILPGGIPRNANGQVDIVQLMSAVSRRVSNGSSLADLLPPEKLQKFADNLTDVLLPNTPTVDLAKMMGRWFEGINSPRASEQRCIVHHYGGLTNNAKTATFTALKIYREGSEFGQVRYSIGYAFRGGNKPAMLQMHTSESADPIPYWIYQLGPEGQDAFGNGQYEWAVVSNWIRYPVTVLVRDPDQFKEKHEQTVLRYLEDNGFINGFVRAFNLVQPASYGQCHYADSTFDVFGAAAAAAGGAGRPTQ